MRNHGINISDNLGNRSSRRNFSQTLRHGSKPTTRTLIP